MIYDPYYVLGLPHGSSIELVKATYRSLVKIYHPDIFKGDHNFAKEKMALLSAAYEFLSDTKQKNEYDAVGPTQGSDKTGKDYEYDDQDFEINAAMHVLREKWDYACGYYPELVKLHSDLKKLNQKVAFTFVVFIIETKEYEAAKSLKNELEQAFLASKFGNDPDLQRLAKHAIILGQLNFANELNKSLNFFGLQAKEKILVKLSKEFTEFAQSAYTECNLSNYIYRPMNTGSSLYRTNPNAATRKPKYLRFSYQAGLFFYKHKKELIITIALIFLFTVVSLSIAEIISYQSHSQ